MNEITVRILRYDPQSHRERYFSTYRLSLKGKWSVLGALQKIMEDSDPQLSFTYSCRLSRCTSCAMRVNGRVVLTCVEPIGGNLDVEPVSIKHTAKDLVTTVTQDMHIKPLQGDPDEMERKLKDAR